MVRAHPLLKVDIREQLPGRLSDPRIVFPRRMRHRENHACDANATDFFNSLLEVGADRIEQVGAGRGGYGRDRRADDVLCRVGLPTGTCAVSHAGRVAYVSDNKGQK
jgi:hypothetical protein